jgi:hypothetical protein
MLELRKWGSHWSMYNFNYEYMTFLYAVHVYMFCNVVLYCIALPAILFIKTFLRLLFIWHCRKKWISSSSTLQVLQSLWCLRIFLYLPSSISNVKKFCKLIPDLIFPVHKIDREQSLELEGLSKSVRAIGSWSHRGPVILERKTIGFWPGAVSLQYKNQERDAY